MEIFTIGHSNYTLEKFIHMLKYYNINCVVDIRGTPYSKYNVQYNKETINITLRNLGITYIYMGIEFAAQRGDKHLYNSEGYADFERVIYDKDFLRGIDRLKKGLEKKFNIAIMGARQEPINCHRCILVGRYLRDNGFKVKHILDDLTLGTQEEMEENLLNKYYNDRNQITIDALLGNELSKEEMINEGYRKSNKEIGYRVEKLKI